MQDYQQTLTPSYAIELCSFPRLADADGNELSILDIKLVQWNIRTFATLICYHCNKIKMLQYFDQIQ